MKWVALVLFLAMIPAVQSWMVSNPRKVHYVWSLLGFLPLVSEGWHIVIAPISWALWPGYVKGLEISPVESIAIAILLTRRSSWNDLPFKWLWISYIFALLLSMMLTAVPMASFFAAWQGARMFLVFAAVVSIARDERGPAAIITGMALGLIVNAAFAIEQRLTGTLQAVGLFSHQNIGGMATHFVALPALAMLLVNRQFTMGYYAVAAGAVIAILGASRGTIAFAAAGYAFVLIASIIQKPTSRKTSLLAGGIFALLAAAPLAMGALDRRFEAAPVDTGLYDERAAFERAARAMWSDHPFGVGANQYVNVANIQGYSEKAGVVWSMGSRSAHVHNVYLLVGAETGYIGLLCFIALIFVPMWTAFKGAWATRNSVSGGVLIGLGTVLVVVAVHSMYEWVFVKYLIQWLFAINLGMIAGIVSRKPRARKQVRADVTTGTAVTAGQAA